jgi:putative lumazine-binding protein
VTWHTQLRQIGRLSAQAETFPVRKPAFCCSDWTRRRSPGNHTPSAVSRLKKHSAWGGLIVSTNRSTVEAVVQHYFDGLYEGDADKLGAIFDSTADLRWIEKGELQVLTVPDWLDRVRKRPSAKAEGKAREDFIVTIDRSDDNTAFVKVRCQLPPRYFTDYLVAMKLKDGWKIVSKSYRYDLKD